MSDQTRLIEKKEASNRLVFKIFAN